MRVFGVWVIGMEQIYWRSVAHPQPKGQFGLMGDKWQHLRRQYVAPNLRYRNISSCCRQLLWLHFNPLKKILSDEIPLS